MLQIPLDALTERDQPQIRAGLVAVQAMWAIILLYAARTVQRRAERKLVASLRL